MKILIEEWEAAEQAVREAKSKLYEAEWNLKRQLVRQRAYDVLTINKNKLRRAVKFGEIEE